MKRKRYIIEGDLINGGSFTDKPRYIGDMENEDTKLADTYFSLLPIEVTCHLLTYITRNKDPRDYHTFLRYLLPLFGIPLDNHQKTYDLTQKILLVESQKLLEMAYPLLFNSCVTERLGRVESAVSLIHDDVFTPLQHLDAVRVLVNASFTEIYAFVNCRFCECCLCELAVTRRQWLYSIGEAKDHDMVPLCAKCGSKMDYSKRIKDTDKNVELGTIKRKPHRAYRWVNEKKLRQWCGIPKTHSIADSSLGSVVRKKIHHMMKTPATLYLLKDMLPFVKERYIDYK